MTFIDVAVAIPWRPEPSRVRAFYRVLRFWDEEMMMRVVTGGCDPGPFNLAQARNRAVSQADTEFVVVADADVLPEPVALETAWRDGIGGEVVWLYDEYRIIDPLWVDMDHPHEAPRVTCFCGQMLPGCCGQTSGLFVCRTETYWRLGGHDERFRTWGGEDRAFANAAGTLTGARRVEGLAVAFDHAQSSAGARDVTKVNPLADAYWACAGDAEAMEHLLAHPARGCQPSGVEEWKRKWGTPTPQVWPPRPEGVAWV